MITPLRLATLLVLLTAAWLGIFRSYIFPKLADLVQETECGASGQACPLMDRNYSALIPKGDGAFPVVVFFHGSVLTGKDIITREHLVRPFIDAAMLLWPQPPAWSIMRAEDKTRAGVMT